MAEGYTPTIQDIHYLVDTQPNSFPYPVMTKAGVNDVLSRGVTDDARRRSEEFASTQYRDYLSNGGEPLTESPIPANEQEHYAQPAYIEPGDGRQSLVGGFFACVWDEIKGLFELAYLLIMLRAEIAIAADGSIVDMDLIWGSLANDMNDVARHIQQIESGDMSGLEAMDADQKAAVLRVRQKLEAIKKAFEDAGETAVDVLAAWDVHIADEEYGFSLGPSMLLSGISGNGLGEKLLKLDDDITLEDVKDNVSDVKNVDLILPANVNATLTMISEALSDSYSDAEWRMRADRGLSALQGVINKAIADAAANPWGTAGKAICIIALTVIPIAALTKVARALKIVFSRIDDLPLGSRLDIDDALRRANPDTTPDVDSPNTTADTDTPNTTPETAPDEIIDGETPGQTTRTDAPDNRETPETDSDTTTIPRTKRIGDHAEADARARLQADGYQTYEITNSSGHGTDIVAIKQTPDGPDVRVIEVKANGSRLNDGQQLGGESHFGSVLNRYKSGQNRTWEVLHHTNQGASPRSMNLQQMLRRAQISETDLSSARYELWKYDNVDPDMPGPVSPPKSTDWSSGTNANQFDLDAQGNRIQDTKTRRDWETPGQGPE